MLNVSKLTSTNVNEWIGNHKQPVDSLSHDVNEISKTLFIDQPLEAPEIGEQMLQDATVVFHQATSIVSSLTQGAFSALGFSTTPTEKKPEEKRTAIMSEIKIVQKEGITLKTRLAEIESNLLATQMEIEIAKGNFQANLENSTATSFQSQISTGLQVLEAHGKEYLETLKEFLENQNSQAELLNELSALDGDEPIKITEAISAQIAMIDQALAQPEIETVSVVDEIAQAWEGFLDKIRSTACDTKEAFQDGIKGVQDLYSGYSEILNLKAHKEIFDFAQEAAKKLKEEQKTCAQMIIDLKKGGKELTADELKLLMDHLKLKQESALETEGFKENLKVFITKQIKAHPTAAKTICSIIAVSLAAVVGGPGSAWSAKIAIDEVFAQYEPEANEDNYVAGIVETIGSYFVGGVSAAAVVGGKHISDQALPEVGKQLLNAGMIGLGASEVGFSGIASFGIGLAAMLALKNLNLFSIIKKDLKRAWRVCKEQKLKIIPKFFTFIGTTVVTHFTSTYRAIREGRIIESITRIAIIAFTGMALVANVASLPLSFFLFYLANRFYNLPYEGPASFNNPKFREYIIQLYNETGKNADSLWEVILEETKDENSKSEYDAYKDEFYAILDAIEHPITKPQQQPEADNAPVNMNEITAASAFSMP